MHIRLEAGRQAAKKDNRRLGAYMYQDGWKGPNDGVWQHIPHLNAKPVRNEISDLGRASILSLSQKWTIYVALLFQKVKTPVMAKYSSRIFFFFFFKKPTWSLFVGYLFWPQTKKRHHPFSLLDSSVQLSWRGCVVLSCLFS